jgi:hypothetical protein
MIISAIWMCILIVIFVYEKDGQSETTYSTENLSIEQIRLNSTNTTTEPSIFTTIIPTPNVSIFDAMDYVDSVPSEMQSIAQTVNVSIVDIMESVDSFPSEMQSIAPTVNVSIVNIIESVESVPSEMQSIAPTVNVSIQN